MFRTAPHAEASEGSGTSLGGRRAWWWGSGYPRMGFGVKVGAEYTDNRKKRGSLMRGKASCSGKTWGAGPKEQKDSASATASGAVV